MPKISELNAITSVANNDLLMVVHDPAGLPSTNKITVNNFVSSVSTQLRGYTGSAGISAGYTGSAGTNGYSGSAGTNGYAGSTGPAGTNGYTGSSGTNGTNGYTGSSGAIGYTGSTAPEGVYAFRTVNAANTYTATLDDSVIYCDPNNISQDITIILPITAPHTTGKKYTVKNLNNSGGGLKVRVTTDNPGSLYIENPITGDLSLYYDLTLTNDQQEWIFDGSIYRHSGSLTSAPIFLASQDTFHQVVIQNSSNANNASGDWVAYNNEGNYEQGLGPFIDMGINSNTYTDTTYGNVWGPSDGYLYNTGGNLIIGPQSDHSIKFLAGNTNTEDVKLVINSTSIYSNTSFIPTQNNVFSLGSADKQWKDLYVSNNTIYINNTPLTIDNTGNLLVNNSPVSTGGAANTVDSEWTTPNNHKWYIRNYNGGFSGAFDGTTPVKWFDVANVPNTGEDVRGAIVEYHAYMTGGGGHYGTIVGTIHWASDYGENMDVTHIEHMSGNSNLPNDIFWHITGYDGLYFKNTTNSPQSFFIQWTARVFYGRDYAC
jgi:hypothetical protein